MPTPKANKTDYITNMRRAKFWLPRTAQWLRHVSTLVNGAKFDLNVWGRRNSKYDLIPSNVEMASNCRFEGCALGWATLEPRHRAAGLRLVEDWGRMLLVKFNDDDDLGAASEFYGIVYDVGEAIFGTAENDWKKGKIRKALHNLVRQHDPIVAAERIERFCNDMGISLLPDEYA